MIRLILHLAKQVGRSGLWVHLILGCVAIHFLGTLLQTLFLSEIFGDLSLSSVVPMPSKGKLNLWLMVASGFFSGCLIGGSFLSYFHTEGRERVMAPVVAGWRFALATLVVCLAWFSGLALVIWAMSRGFGDARLKSTVSVWRIDVALISVCLCTTYVVGALSLVVSGSVAMVVTGISTLGILAMATLERFGLWADKGFCRWLIELIPSGDIGFDVWNWLKGETPSNAMLLGCIITALLAFAFYTLVLSSLPPLRRVRLRGWRLRTGSPNKATL